MPRLAREYKGPRPLDSLVRERLFLIRTTGGGFTSIMIIESFGNTPPEIRLWLLYIRICIDPLTISASGAIMHQVVNKSIFHSIYYASAMVEAIIES